MAWRALTSSRPRPALAQMGFEMTSSVCETLGLLVASVAFFRDRQARPPLAPGETQRHDHDSGYRAHQESDREYDYIADHVSSHGRRFRSSQRTPPPRAEGVPVRSQT